MNNLWSESLVEKTVTYSLAIGDQFYLIENVPARVNEETGEQFFSPATVEHIQSLILGESSPARFVNVPVYQFS
ncbi:MAG: hypothetical protein ACO3NK_11690 [Prochlorotrichaceae cyanobacterium]